jgi:ATP-dependent RNA helicase DeaD
MQTFDELTLSQPLARAISDLGFTKPSPIQAQTLPILLGDRTDFIGLAATGTGKTAAFGIPLLDKLDPKKRVVQALILCPTRELSLQVAGQINLLGKHLGVSALPIYGGSGYGDQLRGLKQGMQVVIGTPGRVIDHLERGTLKLDSVAVVVLDEADEMISMGFREDMETILKRTNREKSNIWLFSATMSPMVRKVADQFLVKPRMVQVNRTEMLSSTVEQSYIVTRESDKPEILCKLIDAADDFYGLIFCQTKLLVMELTRYLAEHSYQVDCLHGDMSQSDREVTMSRFRAKKSKIVVCTDVAARGLDVKDLTHVINFSIPRELDSYVHRIGRTARSGKTGHAISLVTPSHRHLLGKIERLTKSRIREGQIPTRKAIGSKKIAALLVKLQDQKNHMRAIEIMDENWKKALSGMDSTEIAGRFLAMLHPEVFADTGRPAMVRSAPPAESENRNRGRSQRSAERSSNDDAPRSRRSHGTGNRHWAQKRVDRKGGSNSSNPRRAAPHK